jgi:DNA-binding NarL/FixJ family response regulator
LTIRLREGAILRKVRLSESVGRNGAVPGPLRVAIVDDDPDIRSLIALHMSLDDRFEVIAQATDGEAAIELLSRFDIDAMVLDMHMPVVSGRQVLEAARVDRPDMRIVAYSADLGILVEAEGEGAAATVVKGDSLDRLLDALLSGQAA